MLGDGVHRHAEGEQMACHQEETEEQLSGTDDLASDRPSDDFPRVRHVSDMWVACLELKDHVCGIAGQQAQHDQRDYSSALLVWLAGFSGRLAAYGIRPKVAMAEGSDSTPSEIIWASITSLVSWLDYCLGCDGPIAHFLWWF